MKENNPKVRHFFSSLCVVGAVLFLSSPASAYDPEWDYTCFPKVVTKINKTPPPNILILLDRSGSMGNESPTLWSRATQAIGAILDRNVSNQLGPTAYYGFGYYSSPNSYRSSPVFTSDCKSGSEKWIKRTLSTISPDGGTYTGRALLKAKDTYCHTRRAPDQSSATLLITDGVPTYTYDAIDYTCQHRKVAPVYTVGLGPGTLVGFNNFQAAAGGTGTCAHKDALGADPCESLNKLSTGSGYLKKGNWTFRRYYQNNYCSGSYSTTSQEDLERALAAITQQMSCTFPLEAVGLKRGIPKDPTNEYPYLAVELKPRGAKKEVRVPYFASTEAQNAGTPGWTWSFSSEERNFVTLGTDACEAIRNNDFEHVTTQVGCICEEEAGTNCSDDDWETKGLCPEGVWQCKKGRDLCALKTGNLSREYECAVPGKVSHCAFGSYACRPDGTIECVPKSGPMPEVCNGIDDDCDGIADNMLDSWERADFMPALESYKDHEQPLYRRACLGQNACVCFGWSPDPLSTPAGTFFPASLEQYTEDWVGRHGTCECQAD